MSTVKTGLRYSDDHEWLADGEPAELYAPVSGEVVEVNGAAVDDPAVINADAYGAWLIKVRVADEGPLLSPEEYAAANDVEL